MYRPILYSIVCCFIHLSVHAEVILDGTLGRSESLNGPQYRIEANVGKQVGNSLFHSFSQFNLNANESATFSGPAEIQTIISRVTGGNPSDIDGTIRSMIPNADLYLLNPYGIVFGQNARLDVSGSFHASTAHYLRLGTEGRFDARHPQNSLLTVAPITAFGFIDNAIAPITLNGTGEIPPNSASGGLQVLIGKTFSLIGGELNLTRGAFYKTVTTDKNGKSSTGITQLGDIKAPQGRINLVGVASEGEVIPTETDIDVSSFTRLAQIALRDRATVDVSGAGGGSLFIRGGQLVTQNSSLYAKTLADQKAGVISIQGDSLHFGQGSELNADTKGSGQAATVQIKTKGPVVLDGRNSNGTGSQLLAQSLNKQKGGPTGNITIEASEILLTDDAFISIDTYGEGKGGSITLNAAGPVTLISDGTKPLTEISAGTSSKNELAGSGGSIFIQGKSITLKDGAILDTAARGRGNAGQVNLSAQETIDFHGTGGSAENSSKLKAYAEEGSNGGNAGSVFLTARNIFMDDGAYINASTFSSGKAGDIKLFASGTITLTGSRGEGWSTWIGSGSHARIVGTKTGEGGSILIEAGEMNISGGASIASSSAAAMNMISSQAGNVIIRVSGTIRLSGVNPYGENEDGLGSGIYVRTRGIEDNAGDAGKLLLTAGALIIEKGAMISSSTSSYAQGGNIEIKVTGPIVITGDSSHELSNPPGPIQLEYRKGFADYIPQNSISGIYANSSNTSIHAGKAGRIEVSADIAYLADKGVISSSTKNAGGGHISVTTNNLILRRGEITTSVMGGKEDGGNILIEEPQFVVLDRGQIKAQAEEGKGGNIRIIADQFITSPDSVVSASSQKGISGDVMINSPENDISGMLTILSSTFMDATHLLVRCRNTIEDLTGAPSRFSILRLRGRVPEPEDWQSSFAPRESALPHVH